MLRLANRNRIAQGLRTRVMNMAISVPLVVLVLATLLATVIMGVE